MSTLDELRAAEDVAWEAFRKSDVRVVVAALTWSDNSSQWATDNLHDRVRENKAAQAVWTAAAAAVKAVSRPLVTGTPG